MSQNFVQAKNQENGDGGTGKQYRKFRFKFCSVCNSYWDHADLKWGLLWT